MTERDGSDVNEQLLFDVVTTLTANARRVAETAVAGARASNDPDLVEAVATALSTETEAIIAGSDPQNWALIGAIRAAGNAIEAVAVQALRTGSHDPEVALEQAFDRFASYLEGTGRNRIVEANADDPRPAG